MKWSLEVAALVPPGVTTVISTVPLPAGEVILKVVSEVTLGEVPAVAPKSTALTADDVPPQ